MFQPFLDRVGVGSRILRIPEPNDGQALRLPFSTEAPSKSLLFWTPQKESFDAAWAHLSFNAFKKEECIRGLATLFMSLKSGAVAWISIRTGPTGERDEHGLTTYEASDFESGLRQSGFIPELRASDPNDSRVTAWIARRL